MKIVVDENIPQGKDAFKKFGKIILSAGRKITNDLLLDADILIVRSITEVNEQLLKNSEVKFVGTATIGTDHIDKDFLSKNKIYFADAAGCNAFSVAEYVVCAINQYLTKTKKHFSELTMGVVGYGNVGTKVVKFAKALGMNVLINDPPLERNTNENIFCPLEKTLGADIISFHVPLNKSGVDKTYHLINEINIHKIKNGAMLINSSRGPVVQNDILLKRLIEKKDLFTVLDVWENEPNLNSELLNLVDIGTPHIAGYSFEGKINGTKIIYNKLCEFLELKQNWEPGYPPITNDTFEFNSENNFETEFAQLTKKIYDITSDNNNLKEAVKMENSTKAKYFDELRKKYNIRREFNNYSLKMNYHKVDIANKLQDLRFKIL